MVNALAYFLLSIWSLSYLQLVTIKYWILISCYDHSRIIIKPYLKNIIMISMLQVLRGFHICSHWWIHRTGLSFKFISLLYRVSYHILFSFIGFASYRSSTFWSLSKREDKEFIFLMLYIYSCVKVQMKI